MSEKMGPFILVTQGAHHAETFMPYEGTTAIFLGLCADQ